MRFCTLSYYFFFSLSSWSHQKAVDFMAENTAMSLHNINTEIDRYITWPGQVGQPTCFVDRPTDWLTDWLNLVPRVSLCPPPRERPWERGCDWPTDRPTARLNDPDGPTDRLIDWLIDWICCCWQRGRDVPPLPSPLRASVTCCCWHHLTSFGSRPALTRWARLKSRNWGRKLRMHSVWKLSEYSSSIFINTKR